MAVVENFAEKLKRTRNKNSREKAHTNMLQKRIKTFLIDPNDHIPIYVPVAPPGSPIGSSYGCTFESPYIN